MINPDALMKYYFVIAAVEVFYTKTVDKQTQRFSQKFNVLYRNKKQNITQETLGKLQQIAQKRLFTEIEEYNNDINVSDVYIASISTLGHMTEQEFLYKEPVPAPNVIP